jgi:hypothetical protein
VKCTLDKDAYQGNEVIMLKLAVNNMCCIERVRNIIVRLKREIKGQIAPNQINEFAYRDQRHVAEFIYDGLPANSTAEFKYFIDLKNVIYKEEYRQYYNKYNNIITQDERAMLLEQR